MTENGPERNLSIISAWLKRTRSPVGEVDLRRRRLLRLISFTAIAAIVVYACFFHDFQPQDDWVPGTVRNWPLSELASYATCIAFIDGLEKPIISGDGVIESIDGKSFVRDVKRVESAFAMHSANTPVRMLGSANAIFGRYANKDVFVLEPARRPRIVHDGTRVSVDPRRFGSDSEHFVQLSSTPGHFFRIDRSTGEPEPEAIELPTERGDVFTFGSDSWISLEVVDRRVTQLHASGAEYVCEGTYPEITFCGDRRVILALHTGGMTLHGLEFSDGGWKRLSDPFVIRSPNVRALAFDKARGRALLLENRFETARTSLFRSVVDGFGALILVDCASGDVVARRDVKVQSPADRLPSAPWFRATFSPSGEKLFVVSTMSRCVEIDVDAWIEACP